MTSDQPKNPVASPATDEPLDRRHPLRMTATEEGCVIRTAKELGCSKNTALRLLIRMGREATGGDAMNERWEQEQEQAKPTD